jgi:uncharacterized protein (TIGR03083 family)
MQPVEPFDVRDRFAHERWELLRLLDDLAPHEWTLPTACGDWTVKDVAGHILRGDMGIISRLRDDAPGATLPPDQDLLAALNLRNQQWMEATSWISPRLLRDLLALLGDQTEAYFNTLDLTAVGEVVSWAGPDPAPLWLGVARHYTERWHHQQHIRDAVQRPGLTDRWSFAPVIATFVHALPHAFRDAAAPAGAVVTLNVTGEAGGSWSVSNRGGMWQLYADTVPTPAAAVALDQDAFWRLCTKGIAKEAAIQRATIQGDERLAAHVFEIVAIIA